MTIRLNMLMPAVVGAIWCLPAVGQTAGPGSDRCQEGLYQLLTVGDADRALDALEQAGRQTSPGVTAEEILLHQVTCLEWTGRDKQLEGVIDQLRGLLEVTPSDLGPSRILPLDSDVIMQLDLAGLRQASGWRQLGLDLPGADSLLMKRSQRLAMAVTLQERNQGQGAQFLLVAEGDFSGIEPGIARDEVGDWLAGSLASVISLLAGADQVERFLSGSTARKRRVRGVDIHPLPIELPQGTFHFELARPNDRLLLVGDPSRIDFALAALGGRRLGLGADPRAREMRDRLPERATFWLLVAPGELLRRLAELQGSLGLAAHLPSLSGMLIYGRLARDFNLDAKAWTVDAESARILADLARGGLALASLGTQASGLPGMAGLLQSLTVSSAGQQVSISTRFSIDQMRTAFRSVVTKR